MKIWDIGTDKNNTREFWVSDVIPYYLEEKIERNGEKKATQLALQSAV